MAKKICATRQNRMDGEILKKSPKNPHNAICQNLMD